MDHPNPRCLAEVFAYDSSGTAQQRGTGYRVAKDWVLTAAHVVQDAAVVQVWFGAPRSLRSEDATKVDEVDAITALDLALLRVPRRTAPPGFEPPLFGALDRESAVEVPAVALGFPWFKLTPLPGRHPEKEWLRDVHTATAMVVGTSNLKSGTLSFATVGPPPPPASGSPLRSPWGGMSGAAVFEARGGHLIGVIGEHPPAQGAGVLTVRPLQVPPGRDPGLTDDVALVRWAQALGLGAPLPVVTPPTRRELAVRTADEAARQLAPSVLVGRHEEIAELERFAAPGGGTWRWISADAFAGKTALLAWFALHRPAGVDIASCFLSGHLRHTTADYAVGVLTEQLAALAQQEDPARGAPLWDRQAALRLLLPRAAHACQQRGRRLLLIIDGLDEYDDRGGPLDAWLPDALPGGVVLLASSRAGARVALGPDHPLAEHRHTISAAPVSVELRDLAEDELKRTLDGRDTAYDVLGYLAAAGGGLTSHDLAELLGLRGLRLRAAKIDDDLASGLARTIHRVPDPGGRPEQAWVFAHAVLQDRARSKFALDMAQLQGELHEWARGYRTRCWPESTPGYLFEGYRQLLRDGLGSGRDPDPEGVSRFVRVLADPDYREGVRLRRGWLVDYVADIEFLAKRAPDQARDVCRQALKDGYPNSYLRQRLLELLVQITPDGESPQASTSRRHPTLDDIAVQLRQNPIDLAWMLEKYREYQPTSGSPVAAALVLGMGIAGGLQAADALLGIFRSADRQLGWATADALITAATPRPDRPDRNPDVVRAAVIDALIEGYAAAQSAALRRRTLYVLSFLKADEARSLAQIAAQSADSGVVGWAIRLISETGADAAQIDQWLTTLAAVLAGKADPVWQDEWTQKRLIVALRSSRLTPEQISTARSLARKLCDTLDDRPVPKSRQAAAARRALKVAAVDFERIVGDADVP